MGDEQERLRSDYEERARVVRRNLFVYWSDDTRLVGLMGCTCNNCIKNNLNQKQSGNIDCMKILERSVLRKEMIMKIFGLEFQTRKELKKRNYELECELWAISESLANLKEEFPFTLGQTLYDVQLRNDKGRYAKKNVSLEHSLINEVTVDEKNYFGLVERYKRMDVFTSYDRAKKYLEEVCNK